MLMVDKQSWALKLLKEGPTQRKQKTASTCTSDRMLLAGTFVRHKRSIMLSNYMTGLSLTEQEMPEVLVTMCLT